MTRQQLSLKKINPLYIFLAAVLLNGLFWAVLVPIWHTPDEAAHFANVQNMAEYGQMHPSGGKDHSQELLLSERLLGTERGSRGTNKFTFHPEYRLDYSNNVIGPRESEISNFPKEWRRELVKSESTNYPPVYYFLSAITYKIANNGDLFTRVFFARLVSVLCLVGIAFTAFKISQLLFPKNMLYQLVLGSMVAFQPMVTFTSAGVSSDPLSNLLFIAFLYMGARLIISRVSLKNVILAGLITGIGTWTKPQFIITVPILYFLIVIKSFKSKSRISSLTKFSFVFGVVYIVSGGFILFQEIIGRLSANVNPLPYVETTDNVSSTLPAISFTNHLVWTLKHTYAEVLPWYWGVFDWLGVTLPPVVYRVINRVILIAVLGFILKIIFSIKKRDWSKNTQVVAFMVGFALFYFAVLTWWDWGHFKSVGFSLGIQGRYFLPAVFPHMLIIFIGLLTLTPIKFKKYIASLLAIGMITLNLISLYVVAHAYYDTNNLYNFLIQSSQYKSVLIKYPFNAIILAIYLFSLIGLIYILTKNVLLKKGINEYKIN